jgi:hypothetical protein
MKNTHSVNVALSLAVLVLISGCARGVRELKCKHSTILADSSFSQIRTRKIGGPVRNIAQRWFTLANTADPDLAVTTIVVECNREIEELDFPNLVIEENSTRIVIPLSSPEMSMPIGLLSSVCSYSCESDNYYAVSMRFTRPLHISRYCFDIPKSHNLIRLHLFDSMGK